MLSGIKAVIFDLDGTLYSQKKLRFLMFLDILRHYLFRPNKIKEVNIIRNFRRMRESLISCNVEKIEEEQYQCVAAKLRLTEKQVRNVIDDWIMKRPLAHLKKCRYKKAKPLFEMLKAKGIKIAVVSDYPIREKMNALELRTDIEICTADPEINALKPSPKGFLAAAEKLYCDPGECLVIGDRDDKDGEAARRAGMKYIIATGLNIQLN